MKESPAVTVHAATYPSPKMLRLKAIKETVPVYQDTFCLVRRARALELAGGRARRRARARRVAQVAA